MGYTASLISAILLLTAHGNDAARDSIASSQVVSFTGTPDIRTIGESTISHLSASSAADVLRYSSSLQLKDYGGLGGLKTVNVRSLGSQHTSVFIDGIKVNNAQNGQVDLGRYSADNLQSVTLYSSRPSSLLASASELSAGSAVILTTRMPDFSRASGMDASLSYGSFISPAVHCSYSRRLSGKTYLKVLGDIRSTAGNYPFSYTNAYGADTTETRKNSDLFSYHLESAFPCNPAVGTDKERGQAVGQEPVRPGQVFLHKAGLRGQDTGEILGRLLQVSPGHHRKPVRPISQPALQAEGCIPVTVIVLQTWGIRRLRRMGRGVHPPFHRCPAVQSGTPFLLSAVPPRRLQPGELFSIRLGGLQPH